MFYDTSGPIEEYSWGKFVISGTEHSKSNGMKIGVGKDIRLIGSELSKWKERKGHLLTSEMITGVFGKGIQTLIIGVGATGAVECPHQVQEYIKSNGVENLILKKTPDACRLYNEMFRSGKRVALLAHGTC